MDLYLKRYFWMVWLVFIALASWLVARSVNTHVAGLIEPTPTLDLSARPQRAPAAVAATTLDSERFGYLFGIEPPPPPLVEESSAAAAEDAVDTRVCWTCEPVKTNLRLQLLATMVATPKRWSMALISDLDQQKTEYFMVGEGIKNTTIHDIVREPQRVIIVNHDTHRLEYVDAVPGSGAVATVNAPNLGTAPIPAAGASARNDDGDPALAVRKVDENNYSVPKARLDQTLSDLSSVATQARIVPSFKNGVSNGFKLFSIRPGSIFADIGVQNGDVITRINGFDINSPDKALEIYSRLKDARNIEIDIERRGQSRKMTYSID